MPANFPPIQALASVAHKWINAISGAGVATATQPAASDVSGLAASATTDTTNASNISSGTLASGRLSGSYTGVTAIGTQTAAVASSVSATSAPQFDASPVSAISVANGAAAVLFSGSSTSSFLLIITDTTVAGDVGVYLLGANQAGGSALLGDISTIGSFVAPTTTPASGHASVAWDSGSSTWRIHNNLGTTVAFKVVMIRIS